MSFEQIKNITQQHASVVEDYEGSKYIIEYCGLRDAPHMTKGYKKLHFYMIDMYTTAQAQEEIHRRVRLDERVLRLHRIVVKEEFDPSKYLVSRSHFSPSDLSRTTTSSAS